MESARVARSSPSRNGGYTLAGYPDCGALYRGVHEGTSIFVVNREGPDERLFTRRQLADASEWAKRTKTQIENLPSSALCHQAVVDLLG